MPLFPEIDAFDSGVLRVSPIHEIYYEQSGNPEGLPVTYLHGGPGCCVEPKDRQYFDPKLHRIILFDQRGCGKSTPTGELAENTTPHLLADMEALRQHLGIETWLVSGGSWGSTLALLYAQAHPERVIGLVLRNIFLGRGRDIAWTHGAEGAAKLFPELYAQFMAHLREEERATPLAAYYNRLTCGDEAAEAAAAQAYLGWEGALCGMEANLLAKKAEAEANGESRQLPDAIARPFARIEAHYMHHGLFIEDNQVLDNMNKIKKIPAEIIHGRYDTVCPTENAWTLHQAWPGSRLTIVPDAGHSGSECLEPFLTGIQRISGKYPHMTSDKNACTA